MVNETLEIESLGKLSEFYRKTQSIGEIISRRIIERKEHNDLESFLELSGGYINFADSLENYIQDIQKFRGNLIDTYQDVVGAIKGNFDGKYSGDALNKGVIFDTKSESSGDFNGLINLSLTAFEKSIGVSNSSYIWLKEFTNQYTSEMNESLESIQEGEIDSRLVLQANKVNNAIKDIYSNGSATSLLYSTKDILESLKTFESFFYKDIKGNVNRISLHDASKSYIKALEDLKECAENKEIFRFDIAFPSSWGSGSGKYGHVFPIQEEMKKEKSKIFSFLKS